MCVRACECECVCVRERVCVCVCVCVRVWLGWRRVIPQMTGTATGCVCERQRKGGLHVCACD